MFLIQLSFIFYPFFFKKSNTNTSTNIINVEEIPANSQNNLRSQILPTYWNRKSYIPPFVFLILTKPKANVIHSSANLKPV